MTRQKYLMTRHRTPTLSKFLEVFFFFCVFGIRGQTLGNRLSKFTCLIFINKNFPFPTYFVVPLLLRLLPFSFWVKTQLTATKRNQSALACPGPPPPNAHLLEAVGSIKWACPPSSFLFFFVHISPQCH